MSFNINIPDFDIDVSGMTDAFNALTRQYNNASKRLSEGASAFERDIEAERKFRQAGAVRGYAGRFILGGLAVGDKIATSNNKIAINEMVNKAQKQYEQAFFDFQFMTPEQQSKFLNEGTFEKIHDNLIKKLDEDFYGVDTEKIKERWSSTFRANYMRVQLQTYATLRKAQKDRVGSLRAGFRNKIIADPYNEDARNGKLSAEFRNSLNGLVDTPEEATEYQNFDQIYGLLHGFYNHEDPRRMTSILETDRAKEVLGDEYNDFIQMRNRLRKRLEDSGGPKISRLKSSFTLFSHNLNTQQLTANLANDGYGSLGSKFTEMLRKYVSTSSNEGSDSIDLSELHNHIPNTLNQHEQRQIHTQLIESAKMVEKAFAKDPVETYLRIMSNDASSYIPTAERGLVYENTGRILTNREASQTANLLVEAFSKNYKTFDEAQQIIASKIGVKGLTEVYAMMPDLMKGSSNQKKNYMKIISLNSIPEVAGNIPLPEARAAVAKGIGVPTQQGLTGMGDAANKSWSSNDELMDVMKIIAMARTLEDPTIKEGQYDTETFASKYWGIFNELVEDYDSNFQNTTERWGPDREGKGRGGTHLSHRTAVGYSISPNDHQNIVERFENNMNPEYFEKWGRNILSEDTLELLKRGDAKVEADIHNGSYRFYISIPRGEESAPMSYEMTKRNGEHFKLPVQVMYRANGKIFQNIPHYSEQAFDPPSGSELPAPSGADTIIPSGLENTPIGKSLGQHGIGSKLSHSLSQPGLSIPSFALQPVMLKLMYRESRFDPKAVEKGVKGRPPGRGILQLTSPHLTKDIDPHDTQEAINTGTREINRLYEQGLALAKKYNEKRVAEGQDALDFTHGDIMMYALKAWNGGGVDSPRGFNTETIVRAYQGRLSTAGPANNFASSIMFGLGTLSPEEQSEVNMKEQNDFFNFFSKDPRVQEWMDAPITKIQRAPSGGDMDTPSIFRRASSALRRRHNLLPETPTQAVEMTSEELERRKETVAEPPLWQHKDTKTDTYSQYTDKFLEDWFDRIEGVGPLTSNQFQDMFRNFKLGYRGKVFKK